MADAVLVCEQCRKPIEYVDDGAPYCPDCDGKASAHSASTPLGAGDAPNRAGDPVADDSWLSPDHIRKATPDVESVDFKLYEVLWHEARKAREFDVTRFLDELRERTVLFAGDSLVDGPIEDVIAAAQAAAVRAETVQNFCGNGNAHGSHRWSAGGTDMYCAGNVFEHVPVHGKDQSVPPDESSCGVRKCPVCEYAFDDSLRHCEDCGHTWSVDDKTDAPCEHRFPLHGDHRCTKCGKEPEGIVKELGELYDAEDIDAYVDDESNWGEVVGRGGPRPSGGFWCDAHETTHTQAECRAQAKEDGMPDDDATDDLRRAALVLLDVWNSVGSHADPDGMSLLHSEYEALDLAFRELSHRLADGTTASAELGPPPGPPDPPPAPPGRRVG